MAYVYIVVENGEAYPFAYKSYEIAASTVKIKYADILKEQLKEAGGDPKDMASEVDVEEDTKFGMTVLYIEKGIRACIYRVAVLN
jgi:hypothetical protein